MLDLAIDNERFVTAPALTRLIISSFRFSVVYWPKMWGSFKNETKRLSVSHDLKSRRMRSSPFRQNKGSENGWPPLVVACAKAAHSFRIYGNSQHIFRAFFLCVFLFSVLHNREPYDDPHGKR